MAYDSCRAEMRSVVCLALTTGLLHRRLSGAGSCLLGRLILSSGQINLSSNIALQPAGVCVLPSAFPNVLFTGRPVVQAVPREPHWRLGKKAEAQGASAFVI